MFYAAFLIFYTTSDFLLSPDFIKYYSYFQFYDGLIEVTGVEQGHFYYFFSYLFTKIIFILNQSLSMNQLLNISIHLYNSILIFIGLTGFIKYMEIKKYKSIDSYLISVLALFFAPLVTLRLSFKPEILVFAFIFWIMIYLENYFENFTISSFFKASILFIILITSKSSIALGVSLFFVFFLFKFKNKLFNKKNFTIITIFFALFFVVLIENYLINDISIVNVQHDSKYDNNAPVEFFTTIEYKDLVNNPNKYFHKNSFISIVLFDTFNDFFGLYWNSEYTELNTERFQFFKIVKIKDKFKIPQINFDQNKNIFTFIGNYDTRWDDPNYLDETRFRFSFIASIVFYILLLIFLLVNKDKLILLSPFLGILLTVFSLLGIFINNYDPEVGDSAKVFYYSYFVVIAFLFLHQVLFGIKIFPKYLYTGIVFLLLFFFLGFPFQYTFETMSAITYKLSLIPFCNFNYKILDIFFNLNEAKSCNEGSLFNKFIPIVDYSLISFKLIISRIPFVNLMLPVLYFLNNFKFMAKFLNNKYKGKIN